MLKRSLFYWAEDKLLEDESSELNDSARTLQQNETKILGNVLTFLGTKDILNFRLVCKTFNKTLLNQPECLWNKSRVLIKEPDPVSWKQQPMLTLINDLLCSNFHFKNIPLHAVSSFVNSFESVVIRHVKLTSQEFSTAQLYHFLNLCPSVEYLEIIGDPAIYTDSIDKWDLYRKDPVLQMTNLKTLILKSSAAISTTCSSESTSCRYPPTNLSPGFLASLTSFSYLLETVEVAGFPFASFLALSKIFYHDFAFSRIVNLICTDIISPSTDDNPISYDSSRKNDIILFLETLQQLHLSIKKLVIGFHPNSKISLNGDISSEIGKTSVYYGDSIEELTIVNCPVSEHIFEATMPNLKKLVLHKTSAANVAPKTKQLTLKKPVGVFPKLQCVIFSESPAGNERPPITQTRINHQERFVVSKIMLLINNLFWEQNTFTSRGKIFILLALIVFGMFLIEKLLLGLLPLSSSSPRIEQIRMFIHVSAIYGHITFVGRKQVQGSDPIIV